MNPINILREFTKMYEPPADDRDRRQVAEELLEILSAHPVLRESSVNYRAATDVIRLVSEAVQHKAKKDPNAQPGSAEKTPSIFTSKRALIQSFVQELTASLERHFMHDCFEWLATHLAEAPTETEEQEFESHTRIERVACDLLSALHDDGFSFESLFALYRLLASEHERNEAAVQGAIVPSYDFMARFSKVQA